MNFRLFIIMAITFFHFYSCNNENITEITAIKVSPVEKGVLLVGSTVYFEVRANNSTDVTEFAEVKVNGELIENIFMGTDTETGTAIYRAFFETDPEPASYTVESTYNGFSDQINISTDKGFVKNVLIEDYTGTWCGNCPRVNYAIEQAKIVSDKIVSVGVHFADEMQMVNVNELTDEFGITAYPTAKLNRVHNWDTPETNIEGATNYTGFGAPLGLAIDSQINNNTIHATIEVGFQNTLTEDLKLVLYLTEDGLIYDQENYTSYFGGESIIVDFEHNDVLRAVYTPVLGETIPSGETTEGNSYFYEITKEIPASVSDTSKLNIVAFVSSADEIENEHLANEVLNVREAPVGEAQDLQIID